MAAGAAAARDTGSVRRYAGSAPRVHVVRAAQPAAARRPRGGGSPSKRQLLDAMLSWAPCASGDGRTLGYDRNGRPARCRRTCRGTDEPLPRACRACVREVFYEASCRTKKSNRSRSGVKHLLLAGTRSLFRPAVYDRGLLGVDERGPTIRVATPGTLRLSRRLQFITCARP